MPELEGATPYLKAVNAVKEVLWAPTSATAHELANRIDDLYNTLEGEALVREWLSEGGYTARSGDNMQWSVVGTPTYEANPVIWRNYL